MNTKTISGTEDHSEDPYQLVIIVKDTKDFTSKQLISSIAIAVSSFTPVSQQAAERGENWESWLAGRFRKIVKRMKPAQFEKISYSLDENEIEYLSYTGDVELIVLSPQPKSFAPIYLKRAQVSGLSVIDEPFSNFSNAAITVLINTSVDMSVSKMSVAAAHALQMAKQYVFDNDDERFAEWNKEDVAFIAAPVDDSVDLTVEVVDAGLTEVIPGSLTAGAIIR